MVQWDASLLFPSCKCGRSLALLRRRGLFLYEVLGIIGVVDSRSRTCARGQSSRSYGGGSAAHSPRPAPPFRLRSTVIVRNNHTLRGSSRPVLARPRPGTAGPRARLQLENLAPCHVG